MDYVIGSGLAGKIDAAARGMRVRRCCEQCRPIVIDWPDQDQEESSLEMRCYLCEFAVSIPSPMGWLISPFHYAIRLVGAWNKAFAAFAALEDEQ